MCVHTAWCTSRVQGPEDDAAFGIRSGRAMQAMRKGAPLAGACAGFAALRVYAGVPVEQSRGVRDSVHILF